MTKSPEQTTPDHLGRYQRPLSPHLFRYRIFTQITALTSILNRMTGAGLVFGALLVVYWLQALAHGAEAYGRFIEFIRFPLVQLILFGLTWAFWYHVMNGVRHLAWDSGFGFKRNVARWSGKIILTASIVLTFLTWCYLRS